MRRILRWVIIAGLSVVVVAAPRSAAAEAACPANAHIDRTEINGNIQTVHCACDTGYANVGGTCSAIAGADDVIGGLNAMAARLGWNSDKRMRFAAALNSLELPGDFPRPTDDGVRRTWAVVRARGQDAVLASEAVQARGPELFAAGAGQQSNYNDCTIFALANAAGLPYGIVAARAGDLLRDADWRTANERANPQSTVERSGLNGGEVIFLAEAFGQSHVVPPSDFAATISSGEPLMIEVVLTGGDRHEVVLSKAFRHQGDIWYEMIDSNQGPVQRRYLSGQELNTILLASGVAFQPNPGNTVQLPR